MADRRAVPRVTVAAGSEAGELTGQAAAMVALALKHAALINDTNVGQAVVHFANGKAHLELRRTLPPIRCEL